MKRLVSYLLFPFLLCISCTSQTKRETDPFGGLAVPLKKQSEKDAQKKGKR